MVPTRAILVGSEFPLGFMINLFRLIAHSNSKFIPRPVRPKRATTVGSVPKRAGAPFRWGVNFFWFFQYILLHPRYTRVKAATPH